MLPAQVPEAQPEPDAGDLNLCLIKQYHTQHCADMGSLQGLERAHGLFAAWELISGLQGKICPLFRELLLQCWKRWKNREPCALYLSAEDVEVNHTQLLPSKNHNSFI